MGVGGDWGRISGLCRLADKGSDAARRFHDAEFAPGSDAGMGASYCADDRSDVGDGQGIASACQGVSMGGEWLYAAAGMAVLVDGKEEKRNSW